MTMLPPTNRDAYVAAIANLLEKDHPTENGKLNPSWLAADALGRSWVHDGSPTLLWPPAQESLACWLKEASDKKGAFPKSLRMVVGESRGGHRSGRDDSPGSDGLMTRAATSDGVGGAEAAVELLIRAGLTHSRPGQFHGLLDEWEEAPKEAKAGHLIVVGTGEVNLFATFLHGVVPGLYFGHHRWPPQLASLGDKLTIDLSGQSHHLLRTPGGSELAHIGCTVLLRNPWNPDYRLLWVAGLTGRATRAGCLAAGAGWSNRPAAKSAFGAVFQFGEQDGTTTPIAWLTRTGKRLVWEREASSGGAKRPSGLPTNRQSQVKTGMAGIAELIHVLPESPRRALDSFFWVVLDKKLESETAELRLIYKKIKESLDSEDPCPAYTDFHLPILKTWQRELRRVSTHAKESFGSEMDQQLFDLGIKRNHSRH
jgi:hypothetical protein